MSAYEDTSPSVSRDTTALPSCLGTPEPVQASNSQQAAGSIIDKERALAKKYGSLYAADEEKQRRKFQYSQQYERFTAQANDHRMKAEYLADRNKIWAETREVEEAELAKCKSRVEELEGKFRVDDEASEQLNEQLEGDVEAWDDDKEALKKWEAFFSLESDELDV